MIDDHDLERLAADLAAVTEPGPVAGAFGPVLYDEVTADETVRLMAANGLEDSEASSK